MSSLTDVEKLLRTLSRGKKAQLMAHSCSYKNVALQVLRELRRLGHDS